MNFNIDLNALRDRAYKIACEHGFHDEELSNEHSLMLVITELAEAVEADRKGKVAQRMMFGMNCDTPQENPTHHWCFCFDQFVKDTVEDELADAVIRLLDLAGLRRINVEPIDESIIEDMEESCKEETFTESIYFISTLPARYEGIYDLHVTLNGMITAIFGLARHLDIYLLWHIEQKMKYNELREKMHGKKY